MNNIFVLVNPASANGTTREVWPKIAEEMKRRGLEFETHMTTAVGNATDAVRDALKRGKTTIIAVGGDGTANEAVNAFSYETPINPDARLGIISRGTGCDLIKSSIPRIIGHGCHCCQSGTQSSALVGILKMTAALAAVVCQHCRRRLRSCCL